MLYRWTGLREHQMKLDDAFGTWPPTIYDRAHKISPRMPICLALFQVLLVCRMLCSLALLRSIMFYSSTHRYFIWAD